MTSDAPQSLKNGSVTDSTSSSPGTAGSRTRDAWVVGEPSSADPNPENSQQDVESIPVVEIRYPKGIEDDARAYKSREQRRDRWKVFLEALIVVGVLGYGAIAYRQWHTMPAASDNPTKALQTTERAYVTTLQTTERTYVTALQTTERAFIDSASNNRAGLCDIRLEKRRTWGIHRQSHARRETNNSSSLLQLWT